MDRAETIRRLFARRQVLQRKPKPRGLRGRCWIWMGSRQSGDDYGKISIDGAHRYTHRVAAHLWLRMPIDSPLIVRHRCIGNTACFQPLHLRVGTIAQNNGDIVAQGRHSPGNAMCDSAVANLIGCVRSGKVSIGKWASLNHVAYCTAYRAYHGLYHFEAAIKAHERWDRKQGGSYANPILNRHYAIALPTPSPGCGFDGKGFLIVTDPVEAGIAADELQYDPIPF